MRKQNYSFGGWGGGKEYLAATTSAKDSSNSSRQHLISRRAPADNTGFTGSKGMWSSGVTILSIDPSDFAFDLISTTCLSSPLPPSPFPMSSSKMSGELIFMVSLSESEDPSECRRNRDSFRLEFLGRVLRKSFLLCLLPLRKYFHGA